MADDASQEDRDPLIEIAEQLRRLPRALANEMASSRNMERFGDDFRRQIEDSNTRVQAKRAERRANIAIYCAIGSSAAAVVGVVVAIINAV